ncbi:MAG: glycosyltransferase [Ruminococcus sp.]|nr:glycosyltransferase [Ruminococcus sp.]MCC8174605.1 glycosyltransferase [Odoribacter sp.]
MDTISIIVNLYNSEKYIPKLLKSVANQTYSNWQLICIDDCSPGKDSEIIIKWSKKLGIETKVILIRNPKNLGISKAKEVGIQYVRQNCDPNDYTTFMDGDDWLEPTALETLYTATDSDSVELILGNYFRTYKIGPFYKKVRCNMNVEDTYYNHTFHYPDNISCFLKNFLGVNVYHNAYWGKLYKNDLLNRLEFVFPEKEDTAGEDFFFSLAILLQCKSLKLINTTIYNWRWGGIMSGRKNSDWQVMKIYKPILESYIYRKSLIEKYYLKQSHFYLMAELKNTSLNCWSSIAKADPDSPESIRSKNLIAEMIQNPAFNDFRPDFPKELALNDLQMTFLKALSSYDVNTLYNCCHQYGKIKKTRNGFLYFIRWIL